MFNDDYGLKTANKAIATLFWQSSASLAKHEIKRNCFTTNGNRQSHGCGHTTRVCPARCDDHLPWPM